MWATKGKDPSLRWKGANTAPPTKIRPQQSQTSENIQRYDRNGTEFILKLNKKQHCSIIEVKVRLVFG